MSTALSDSKEANSESSKWTLHQLPLSGERSKGNARVITGNVHYARLSIAKADSETANLAYLEGHSDREMKQQPHDGGKKEDENITKGLSSPRCAIPPSVHTPHTYLAILKSLCPLPSHSRSEGKNIAPGCRIQCSGLRRS